DVSTAVLTNPDRLMLELHRAAGSTDTTATSSAVAMPPTIAAGSTGTAAGGSSALSKTAASNGSTYGTPALGASTGAALNTPPASLPSVPLAPPVRMAMDKAPTAEPSATDSSKTEAAKAESAATATAPTTILVSTAKVTSAAVTTKTVTPASAVPGAAGGVPKAARHTAAGETSLVRALGLKLQRIVIDPGHGGHDEGTQGPHGLLEKELVLDVSQRLGKMIEEKLGAEVVYTRSDDTFVPLEGRTAIANDKKADLFLSIHANSSPVARITGVETYFLNFTDMKDALEVATRENAGAEKSIFELRDLIQKISLHDKASESRDFAERLQNSLFAFSSKTFTTEKNRGVKQAPFVVLIGANMPSVLAEIGFVSNTREEALLKRPEYRQRLAEALFRGVSKYADSLSHFQVAAN
ncbi:MAG TPA: N-acetylmuramoyl-L-alanine amidase, partial [Bryobacteraceae bacterium]|nr:N-acetylmuramoyl-L-alanine amidase [Bryobacteraceae bacterium]